MYPYEVPSVDLNRAYTLHINKSRPGPMLTSGDRTGPRSQCLSMLQANVARRGAAFRLQCFGLFKLSRNMLILFLQQPHNYIVANELGSHLEDLATLKIFTNIVNVSESDGSLPKTAGARVNRTHGSNPGGRTRFAQLHQGQALMV